MAKTLQVYTVFISSPSDVTDEREIAEEVINELNNTLFSRLGFMVRPIRWETHSYPGMSEEGPQSVINKQLADDYDIFVGILWGRFGTPTKSSLSGTEEEFNQAYQRWEVNKNSVDIMLYFKQKGISPTDIDVEQIKRVKDFKAKIKNEALYFSYKETSEFRDLFRAHLMGRMLKEADRKEKEPHDGTLKTETVVEETGSADAGLEDEGFLDLIELSVDDFADSGNSLEVMRLAMEEVSNNVRFSTEELQAMNSKKSKGNKVGEYKRIVNKLAEHMMKFVATTEQELPAFAKSSSSALERYGRAASLLEDFEEVDIAIIDKSIDSVVSSQKAMDEYFRTNESLIATIRSTPRTTSSYNYAKRKTLETLEKIQSILVRNGLIAIEVEEVMRQIRKRLTSR